jgi:acyl carrier protein
MGESQVTKLADSKLRNTLAKVLLLDEDEITDELARKDLEAWDSLGHLMLISEVESTFRVTLSDDDILAIKTVGDVKKMLRKYGVDI